MSEFSLCVLGCGDAFCSGGRSQTCFHLKTEQQSLLLDCGATTLLAMRRQHVDPGDVDRILISHLHGDHFGGVPFLLLHAHFELKRTKPLSIIGPRGTEKRITAAINVLFPDVSDIAWSFPLEVIELEAGDKATLADIGLSSYLVDHPSGAPALAFRLTTGGKVVAFSGDTRWTDALIDVADDADLLIAECHGYKPNGVPHLDWETLSAHKSDLRAKRILLTHMSDSMLQRLPSLVHDGFEFAEDGLVTEI
jgi:ribonuclease BN (tRNA processing enzyme)